MIFGANTSNYIFIASWSFTIFEKLDNICLYNFVVLLPKKPFKCFLRMIKYFNL